MSDVGVTGGMIPQGGVYGYGGTGAGTFPSQTATQDLIYGSQTHTPVLNLGYINPITYGADPTGVKGSTTAILAAVTAAFNTRVVLSTPAGAFSCYVPTKVNMTSGVYLLDTALDFSTVLNGTGFTVGAIRGFTFICDPGVVFIQGPGITSTVITIDVTSGQMLDCTFDFPHIIGQTGGGFASSSIFFIRNFSNGSIHVKEVTGAGSDGFFIDSSAATFGTFNNNIWIELIQNCVSHGFLLNGQVAANAIGIQGNLIQIDECINNTGNGIIIDASGVGRNTKLNQIRIGVCEHNGGAGIVDNNGLNQITVGNTNNNTNLGYVLGSTANANNGAPNAVAGPIRGNFTDGTTLNLPAASAAQKVDIVNYATTTPGTDFSPGVPASGTAVTITGDRPVDIILSGGTMTAFTVNGGTSLPMTTAGHAGRYLPGETITLTYTVAPTWKWVKR